MERKVDFNLFQAFIAVYELGSLKKAGLELGVSESAMSKQINKLSEQLGEALFVRTATGLEPTYAATSRVETIRQALVQLAKAIPPQEFFPEEYDQPIRVALFTSYMQTYGSLFYVKLSKTFPNAFIELVSWDSKTTNEILKGETQMGVHFYNESRPNSIFQVAIADDPICAFIGSQHKVPTWQELISWPFVQFIATGWSEDGYRYRDHLIKNGVNPEIRGAVNDAGICSQLLSSSNLATFMQRSYKTDKMHEIVPPKQFEYTLKTACCVSLTQRQAPLQRLLIKVAQNIIKPDG